MKVHRYYALVAQRRKTTMKDKVEFPKNVPQEVALAYATGREGENGNGPYFLYSTDDDRVFFATPTLNQKIQAAGPRAHQRVEICLRNDKSTGGKNIWDVRLVEQPDPGPADGRGGVNSAAVPSEQRNIKQSNGTSNGNGNGNGHHAAAATLDDPRLPARRPDTYLFQFYADAVDLVIAVEKYAATCGRDLRFTSEDVRAIAATSRIEQQKFAGGR